MTTTFSLGENPGCWRFSRPPHQTIHWHLVGFVVALRPLEGLSGITDGRLGPTQPANWKDLPIFRHFLGQTSSKLEPLRKNCQFFRVFRGGGGELWPIFVVSVVSLELPNGSSKEYRTKHIN